MSQILSGNAMFGSSNVAKRRPQANMGCCQVQLSKTSFSVVCPSAPYPIYNKNMNWIFLAVLSAFFFGAYNVFIKVSSSHINEIVGAVILQVVAAMVGGIILIALKASHSPMVITQRGIWFAVLAGVMVGLAEITSFFLFSKGISASIGIPIIIGGSIVVGTLLGLTFLKETLQPVHYVGTALIVIGVVLLTTK